MRAQFLYTALFAHLAEREGLAQHSSSTSKLSSLVFPEPHVSFDFDVIVIS